MTNHDPAAFEATAREVGFLGFGFYPRSGFMHIDLGPARQWGERFPVRATAFASETPPAREVLVESRSMKGRGAAGVATLGAAGVEVAQNYDLTLQDQRLLLRPNSGHGRPVEITFTAGYGAPADVPAAIRQAMLLLIAHWYEHREAVSLGASPSALPMAVDALLAPYRRIRL